MSSTEEPGSIEWRLAEVYEHFLRELGHASNATRLGLRGYGATWSEFAAALRAWMQVERDVLFPAIDRALPICTDRARLALEHDALERSLARAAAQLHHGGREDLLETAQAALFILYRHGMRARRRYGAQLDRALERAERLTLLSSMPRPANDAARYPAALAS